MPTILRVRGWRVFFYSDEGQEPIHIHARKGGAECKLWLLVDDYDIDVAWSYNLNPALRREIRKIVFDHFELIVEEWDRYFSGGEHAEN